MRKILFVDDEVAVLDGLRDRLRGMRRQWEMRFAVSGDRALVELETWEADVVVSDMRMPDLDGATLLELVRDRQPGAVRIILSGQTELAQELRVLRVAHRFLSKPCDADELRDVIERTCALRDVFSDPAFRDLVGAASALPSPP
jgi:DNA-binding NtrC family response regulator